MIQDIFLGGPFTKHEPYDDYKIKIKSAFPDKDIFDPETQEYQKTGDWFQENAFALENSLALVAYIPDFPFAMVGPEVGIFYTMHDQSNFTRPLDEIIIIWPETLKPDYAKKAAAKMGYVVENPDEAIVRLKKLFEF
ncbi:MAG: hypothetical protein KKF46_03065 [Nanoarchaeota archaeon]|nr:hypothetical protein [Nanoarchaeota archaeon]MBU1321314.1 hypothetical protein [Nanoarchaeota archaeon]MBU1597521.1 hypothetical protein [Nanoarchaeota archaeon]MBU2441138.1 hypothetical protein [Nanoarchaeota archaeon]